MGYSMKFELWNQNCVILKNKLIIKNVGTFLKEEVNIYDYDFVVWILSNMLEKEVQKIEMDSSISMYCLAKKINAILINKTTIRHDNKHLIIEHVDEDPFILFRILLTYKMLNEDDFIKIKMKKNLFEYINKKKIKIKILGDAEDIFTVIPYFSINGYNLTTLK